jgi:hypothetical protein
MPSKEKGNFKTAVFSLLFFVAFGVFFVGQRPVHAVECIKDPAKMVMWPGSLCAKSCAAGWRVFPDGSCIMSGDDICCVKDVAADLAAATCKGAGYSCSGNGKCDAGATVDTGKTCLKIADQTTALTCCYKAPPPTANPRQVQLPDPLNGGNLLQVMGNVIRVFLGTVGAISLLVFFYAGLMYLFSGGSPEMVTKGKETMKYGAIGLIVIMAAYVITSLFLNVLS